MNLSFFKNLFAGKGESDNEQKTEAESIQETPAVQPAQEAQETEADLQFSENEGLSENRSRRGGRGQRRQRGRNGEQRRSRSAEETDAPKLSDEEAQAVLDKLEEFVAFAAKSLVDEPEKVSTKVVDKDGASLILVSCEKKDTGKIIGRSGKIIAAVRLLVSGSASKNGLKVSVDIDE